MLAHKWRELEDLCERIGALRERLAVACRTGNTGLVDGLTVEMDRATRQRERLVRHISTQLGSAAADHPRASEPLRGGRCRRPAAIPARCRPRIESACRKAQLPRPPCGRQVRHHINLMMVTAPDFFRFTICGIPELGSHCEAGVTHVLSILDPEWPDPPEFEDYAPHRRMALRFHDIIDPLPGRIAPTRDDVSRLLAFGHELSDAETCHLLVHCHAGVSRSTAATALILAQAHPELPAREVFEAVSRLRPRAWPNLRILEFGDELLGRGGEIVAAAGPIYRRVLDREPSFQEAMIEGGRAREVIAALSVAG